MATVNTRGNRRDAFASTIGNVLEWYDFVLFGFLSIIIAKQFFPSSSEYAALLLTTATFGAGFVVRPLGGVLLGMYADRAGRKAGLTMVITMMTVSAAIMAFTPSFRQIGIVAPVLILFARLLQGVSAGGEFGTATAMMVEYAPTKKKTLYGSWQMFAQGLGALMAIGAGSALTSFFTPHALESWAWRIPFAIGLLIGPVGFYLRRNMKETDEFTKVGHRERIPFTRICADYPRELFIATALSGALNIYSYVIMTYLPIFAVRNLGMPVNLPFNVLIIAVIFRLATIPLFGMLADRIGKRTIMGVAWLGFLILLYPGYYWIISAPSFTSIMTVELVFAIFGSAACSPIPTALAELFPTEVRSTGLSISYNIAASVFGGFSPFLLTWLLHNTGDKYMPAHYAAVFFALGLVGVVMMKNDSVRRLPNLINGNSELQQ
jgi:MHS family proline/betaine transporter-like MFS transporter